MGVHYILSEFFTLDFHILKGYVKLFNGIYEFDGI